MWPIFSILLASSALAYLLDPIADRLEARGYKRDVGIAMIFTAAICVFAAFILIMIPMMAAQFIELSGNVRGYLDNLAALVQPAVSFIESQTGQTIPVDVESLKAELPDLLKGLSPDTKEGIKDFLSSLSYFLTSKN